MANQISEQVVLTQNELEELLSENAALKEQLAKKGSKKAKKEYVFTPYQAMKVMNAAREELGLKPINSPMLYIYAGKNAFKVTLTADGRQEVDKDSFFEWMEKHNAKQIAEGKGKN